MRFFGMLAVLLVLFPSAAAADDYSGKLDGTWIETRMTDGFPRTVLRFNGDSLRVENMYGKDITVAYTAADERPVGYTDGFTVSFEYRYKVKRGNGRIVEHRDAPEFFYHAEDGRPVLSMMAMELDGRGLVVLSDFLREEDFTDGFVSELRHRLNDRPYPPMYKE